MSLTEIRFAVRVTPRAVADRIDGIVDGVLRAHIAAPAVEGAANHALVRLIAESLGISRGDIRIVAGATSRQKLVVIEHVDRDAVIARWPDLRV